MSMITALGKSFFMFSGFLLRFWTWIILEDYEDLEEQDIFACLAYASRLAQVKSIQ